MKETHFHVRFLTFLVLVFGISSRVVKAFDYKLRGHSISSTEIEVSWDRPGPQAFPNDGILYGYRIYYESKVDYLRSSLQSNPDETRYTISRLRPGTLYNITVRAKYATGLVQSSTAIWVKTKDAVLSKPRELKASYFNDGSICLEWRAPSNENGQVQYTVSWTHDHVSQTKKVIPDEHSYNVDTCVHGLTPVTKYVFKVAGENNAGMGQYTDPLLVTTDVPAPGVPRNLTATRTGLQSITVSWLEPSFYNPRVDSYRIRGTSSYSGHTEVTTQGNDTQYTFHDLPTKRDYQFQVRAFTKSIDPDSHTDDNDKWGEWTEPITFQLTMDNFKLRGDPIRVNLMTSPSFAINCSYEPEPNLGGDSQFISLTISKARFSTNYEVVEMVSINATSNVQILDKNPSTDLVYSGEARNGDKKAYYVAGKWSEFSEDLAGYYSCTLKLINSVGLVRTFQDRASIFTIFDARDVKREFRRVDGELQRLKDQMNFEDTDISTKNLKKMIQYLNGEVKNLKAQNSMSRDLPGQLLALAEATLQLTQSKDYNQSNYIAVNQRIKDAEIANAICKITGGYLLEVNDEEEWKFVKSFLASTKVDRAFIAGRRNVANNKWFWPRNQQKMYYFDWYPNKPIQAAENCIEAVRVFEWQWKDIACQNDFDVFICEIPKA